MKLPAKMHLDGRQGRFGRTMGSADPSLAILVTAFLWVTNWWVLRLVR